MNPREKRRHPRINALNFLSYVEKEGGVQKCAVSMARTLDISESGVRVELFQSIKNGSHMEMEIAVCESIYSATGRVIHSEETEDGRCIVGIEFDEPLHSIPLEFD